MAIGLWAVLCLAGVPVMANSKPFVCANEKDHLPPLDPQADAWYREAAALAKPDTLRPWGRIVELYSKAVERGHWKAMHNLASLYRTGWPGGVEKDTQKALARISHSPAHWAVLTDAGRRRWRRLPTALISGKRLRARLNKA
ncbi:UNVERIFIED_CONTAM: hypothetical protein O1L33_16165, partial [Pseudomonas aeruginosa]